jgi:hypothetical protein
MWIEIHIGEYYFVLSGVSLFFIIGLPLLLFTD